MFSPKVTRRFNKLNHILDFCPRYMVKDLAYFSSKGNNYRGFLNDCYSY